MIIVGAMARVDLSVEPSARERLDEMEGVSTFSIQGDGRLGVLIEAAELDDAYELLQGRVALLPEVMGVWPVSIHSDDEFAVAPEEQRKWGL